MNCPSKWLCPPYGAAVVGTIKIVGDGEVSITTDNLQKDVLPRDLRVSVSNELLKALEAGFIKENKTSEYGLVIIACQNPLKAIAFFSFMSSDTPKPERRTATNALGDYTKWFEDFARLDLAEQAIQLQKLYPPHEYSSATAS